MPTEATPEAKDIDFEKEAQAIEEKPRQSKYTEREKAANTLKSVYTRFPDLKETIEPAEIITPKEDIDDFKQDFLRQQAEAEIRKRVKSDAELKVVMFNYDHRVGKSGNVFEDIDDAYWLAHKRRTRNALEEMKRNPTASTPQGAGIKPPISDIPPILDAKRLKDAGMTQTAPDTWEGKSTKLVYDKKEKAWKTIRK